MPRISEAPRDVAVFMRSSNLRLRRRGAAATFAAIAGASQPGFDIRLVEHERHTVVNCSRRPSVTMIVHVWRYEPHPSRASLPMGQDGAICPVFRESGQSVWPIPELNTSVQVAAVTPIPISPAGD